jgi:uncharacterized protein YeeX (DUF496 family)
VTKYSWDGQILHKTKSESGPKLEKKLRQQQNRVFLMPLLRDLFNLKDHIKKGMNLASKGS